LAREGFDEDEGTAATAGAFGQLQREQEEENEQVDGLLTWGWVWGVSEDELQVSEVKTIERTPEAVIPDLVKAFGQDVLEEPSNEFLCWKGHLVPSVCAGIPVEEGDVAMVHGEDAGVTDGDAMDVAGQIAQNVLGALNGWLAVDVPVGLPDGGRGLDVRQFGFQLLLEHAAKDPG
jgi:hypothetical protein